MVSIPSAAHATAVAVLGAVDPIALWMWSANIIALLFAFAFGSCVGSLTNVLVYRLPRGIGVVTPPSACPSCGTRLTWRENVPVIGWLLLRGRCRFCSVKISPEYPIVEAVVGLLFAAFYALWYIVPAQTSGATFLGVHWSSIAPGYAAATFQQSWPAFILLMVLVGSLVAMTIVDAKTFTIPLVLAWVPAALAAIVHPLYALWYEKSLRGSVQLLPRWEWIIASPGRDDWFWIGGSIGGMVGVVVANVLLSRGMIRRSFADYEEWEAKALAERRAEAAAAGGAEAAPASPDEPFDPSNPPVDLWVQYPHARREVMKELVFLSPILGLGFAGAKVAHHFAGPWSPNPVDPYSLIPATAAPLWLVALSAVFLGYLVGGGVVWGVRILGALAFGKDAMGLGDVHLLAAIGACLGWVDAVIAFFLAAFVGLLWAIVGTVSGGRLRRVLPFGPYIAIGAVLAILCKPALWALFTFIAKTDQPVRWP